MHYSPDYLTEVGRLATSRPGGGGQGFPPKMLLLFFFNVINTWEALISIYDSASYSPPPHPPAPPHFEPGLRPFSLPSCWQSSNPHLKSDNQADGNEVVIEDDKCEDRLEEVPHFMTQSCMNTHSTHARTHSTHAHAQCAHMHIQTQTHTYTQST